MSYETPLPHQLFIDVLFQQYHTWRLVYKLVSHHRLHTDHNIYVHTIFTRLYSRYVRDSRHPRDVMLHDDRYKIFIRDAAVAQRLRAKLLCAGAKNEEYVAFYRLASHIFFMLRARASIISLRMRAPVRNEYSSSYCVTC